MLHEENVKISVIIPVYNAEKYLEKCVNSILKQTYHNLEILFIDDGSTDNSYHILKKYQDLDSRIMILKKSNEGVGTARNVGIEAAKGAYIMFVDSDDWIAANCVELLYKRIKADKTEAAMGDFAKTFYESEEIERISKQDFEDVIDVRNEKKNLFRILAFPWAKLYKKSLFFDYNIRFPNHAFEDPAVIPLLYVAAGRISYVKEVVYYYRNREGSIVNDIQYISDRMKAMTTLKEGLVRLGIYGAYQDELEEYIQKRSRLNVRKVKELATRYISDFDKAQTEYVYKNFGFLYDKNWKCYVYGSYNLMIIVKIILRLKKQEIVPNYYGFQNIISSTSDNWEKLSKIEIALPDSFRLIMFMQDFGKKFMRMAPQELQDMDYLFIDLLEERCDTGCSQGEYFTISDGFEKIKDEFNINYNVIKSFGEEWRKIWFTRCERFIEHITKYENGKKIILVKMKLTETYGNNEKRRFFSNISEIKKINENLEECYQFFQKKCPEAMVVEIENLNCYYTDEDFRHGCLPWHLNEGAYKTIAKRIEANLC